MTFVPAAMTGSGFIDPTVEKAMTSPDTYSEGQGALLFASATDTWSVCGANPSLVGAVALTPGGPDTTSLSGQGGFNILGRSEFPRTMMQGILVQNSLRFRARYLGDLPAVVGSNYGVLRDPADGLWKVDFDNVSQQVVRYVGGETAAPESQPQVFVVFLTAVVQQN